MGSRPPPHAGPNQSGTGPSTKRTFDQYLDLDDPEPSNGRDDRDKRVRSEAPIAGPSRTTGISSSTYNSERGTILGHDMDTTGGLNTDSQPGQASTPHSSAPGQASLGPQTLATLSQPESSNATMQELGAAVDDLEASMQRVEAAFERHSSVLRSSPSPMAEAEPEMDNRHLGDMRGRLAAATERTYPSIDPRRTVFQSLPARDGPSASPIQQAPPAASSRRAAVRSFVEELGLEPDGFPPGGPTLEATREQRRVAVSQAIALRAARAARLDEIMASQLAEVERNLHSNSPSSFPNTYRPRNRARQAAEVDTSTGIAPPLRPPVARTRLNEVIRPPTPPSPSGLSELPFTTGSYSEDVVRRSNNPAIRHHAAAIINERRARARAGDGTPVEMRNSHLWINNAAGPGQDAPFEDTSMAIDRASGNLTVALGGMQDLGDPLDDHRLLFPPGNINHPMQPRAEETGRRVDTWRTFIGAQPPEQSISRANTSLNMDTSNSWSSWGGRNHNAAPWFSDGRNPRLDSSAAWAGTGPMQPTADTAVPQRARFTGAIDNPVFPPLSPTQDTSLPTMSSYTYRRSLGRPEAQPIPQRPGNNRSPSPGRSFTPSGVPHEGPAGVHQNAPTLSFTRMRSRRYDELEIEAQLLQDERTRAQEFWGSGGIHHRQPGQPSERRVLNQDPSTTTWNRLRSESPWSMESSSHNATPEFVWGMFDAGPSYVFPPPEEYVPAQSAHGRDDPVDDDPWRPGPEVPPMVSYLPRTQPARANHAAQNRMRRSTFASLDLPTDESSVWRNEATGSQLDSTVSSIAARIANRRLRRLNSLEELAERESLEMRNAGSSSHDLPARTSRQPESFRRSMAPEPPASLPLFIPEDNEDLPATRSPWTFDDPPSPDLIPPFIPRASSPSRLPSVSDMFGSTDGFSSSVSNPSLLNQSVREGRARSRAERPVGHLPHAGPSVNAGPATQAGDNTDQRRHPWYAATNDGRPTQPPPIDDFNLDAYHDGPFRATLQRYAARNHPAAINHNHPAVFSEGMPRSSITDRVNMGPFAGPRYARPDRSSSFSMHINANGVPVASRTDSLPRRSAGPGQNEQSRSQRDIHNAVQRRLRLEAAALAELDEPEAGSRNPFNLAMDVLREDPTQGTSTATSARERELVQRFHYEREHMGDRTTSRTGNSPWGELDIEGPPSGFASRARRRPARFSMDVDDADPTVDVLNPSLRRRRPDDPSSEEDRHTRRHARARAHYRIHREDPLFNHLDSGSGLLNYLRRSVRLGDYMRDEDFDSSYEGLIGLAERMGDARPHATPREVIEKLAKATFADWRTVGGDTRCPICLDDYEESNALTKIPNCNHFFHTGCITQWLEKEHTCPVCRGKLPHSEPTTRAARPGPRDAGPSRRQTGPPSDTDLSDDNAWRRDVDEPGAGSGQSRGPFGSSGSGGPQFG